MSKRTIFPAKVVPEIETNYNNLVKWIPLLCAGAAAGISIIALKEIKNIKNEMLTLKGKGSDNSELNKKMENMEEQLKTITSYLKSKNELPKRTPPLPQQPPSPQQPPLPLPKENTIIKNVIKEQPEVKIINEDEYEEIEVTDDEAE